MAIWVIGILEVRQMWLVLTSVCCREGIHVIMSYMDISIKADIHKDVVLSNFIEIRDYCVIGEGTRIGSFVIMGAGTYIGKNCQIHGMAAFADQDKHFNRDVLAPILGNNVKLGTAVKVMAGAHIGNNVEVGANSTVFCDIPEGQVWGGTPARYLRDVK